MTCPQCHAVFDSVALVDETPESSFDISSLRTFRPWCTSCNWEGALIRATDRLAAVKMMEATCNAS